MKCKWKGCQREFDIADVIQRYGKDSRVCTLGYCSAHCYRRDIKKHDNEKAIRWV